LVAPEARQLAAREAGPRRREPQRRCGVRPGAWLPAWPTAPGLCLAGSIPTCAWPVLGPSV